MQHRDAKVFFTSLFVLIFGFFSVAGNVSAAVQKPGSKAPRARQPQRSKPQQSKPLSYDQVIEQCEKAYYAGDFVRVFSLSQQAMQLNPQGHIGYYYASYALFKQELLDDAKRYAQQCKEHAPQEFQSMAQGLLEAIESTANGLAWLEQAKKAASRGDTPAAANAYEQAYLAIIPARDDLGLNAARLYGELNKLSDGIRVLKAVKTKSENADIQNRAADMQRDYERKEKERADKIAEDQRKSAEEARQAEQERQAERDRQRAEDAERRKEEDVRRKVRDLEGQERDLESERERIEQKIQNEERAAERDENSAEEFEREAERYERTPAGGPSAVIARYAVKRNRESATRHRNAAKQLAVELRSVERKLEKVQQELIRLRN
ncbi:MAG: hypothetical protein MOB07_27435 [Acidobacteria bacterium]|nr:hypothetical protein [Acidobacteriota bacterium]